MSEAFEEKVEKLCDLVMKTDLFWEDRNKAVIQLVDLFLPFGGRSEEEISDMFTANVFRAMKEPIKTMICDLRSQQVRDVCTLLTVLAQICGDRMKMLLRDIFTNILDGVKVPNKVMSGYVDECILEMIKHSTFKSAIPSIVNEIINSKAKNLRERCLVYLNEIVLTWELLDKEFDPVCDAIRSGLEDASPVGRENARRAYLNVYQLQPRKTERLKAQLTSAALRAKLTKAESEAQLGSSAGSTTVDSTLSSSSKSVGSAKQASKSSVSSTIKKTTKSNSNNVPAAATATPMSSKARSANVSILPTVQKTPAHASRPTTAVAQFSESVDQPEEKLTVQTNTAPPARTLTLGARRRSMVPNPFESITNVQPSPTDGGYCSDSDRSVGTAASGMYVSCTGPPSPVYTRPSTIVSGSGNVSSTVLSSSSSPGKLKPCKVFTASGTESSAPAVPRPDEAMDSKSTVSAPISSMPPPGPGTSVGQNGRSLQYAASKVHLSAASGDISLLVDLNSLKAPSPIEPSAIVVTPPKAVGGGDSLSKPPKNLTVDMAVVVSRGNKEESVCGTIRFIGTTQFAHGTWIGVELLDDVGKNDGTVQGKFYFACPPLRGLFVREENVEPLSSTSSSNSSGGDTSGGINYLTGEIVQALQQPSPTGRMFNASPAITISNPSADTVLAATAHAKERSNLKGLLKLKIAQLMDLLNGQLQIVQGLERAEALSSDRSSSEDLYREIMELTAQETQLIESFSRRMQQTFPQHQHVHQLSNPQI